LKVVASGIPALSYARWSERGQSSSLLGRRSGPGWANTPALPISAHFIKNNSARTSHWLKLLAYAF